MLAIFYYSIFFVKRGGDCVKAARKQTLLQAEIGNVKINILNVSEVFLMEKTLLLLSE